MNYSDLSTAIQDYCENAELAFLKQINNFISFTEDKIFSSMSPPVFWKSSSATSFTSSASEYETAAGVLDILAVRVSETAGDADGPLRYLLRKDYNFIYEAFPGSATGADTGIPKYYAVSSAQKETSDPTNPSMKILIGPRPASGTIHAVIDYYGKSTSDSITNGVVIDSSTGAASGNTSNTTWLSIAFPEVLLYGSLVYAYTYMKGEPNLLNEYNSKFQEGLLLLKNLSESREDTDTYSDLGKPSSAL